MYIYIFFLCLFRIFFYNHVQIYNIIIYITLTNKQKKKNTQLPAYNYCNIKYLIIFFFYKIITIVQFIVARQVYNSIYNINKTLLAHFFNTAVAFREHTSKIYCYYRDDYNICIIPTHTYIHMYRFYKVMSYKHNILIILKKKKTLCNLSQRVCVCGLRLPAQQSSTGPILSSL